MIMRKAEQMTLDLENDFLCYLATHAGEPGSQLPPLTELSQTLGISISKLREQMEVARALGLVEIRPRTGMQTLPYSLFPGLRTSMRYALSTGVATFQEIKDLREHLEMSFWKEAVHALTKDDKRKLVKLVERAWTKLQGNPIQIPHTEHRELHLTIFSRLNNIFVLGILEAYWDAYEIIGLNMYTDYQYLEDVWTKHELMVNAIDDGDLDRSFDALVNHFAILATRPAGSRGMGDEVMETHTYLLTAE
jgi:DNA-binding FadR family transcriptional regulator